MQTKLRNDLAPLFFSFLPFSSSLLSSGKVQIDEIVILEEIEKISSSPFSFFFFFFFFWCVIAGPRPYSEKVAMLYLGCCCACRWGSFLPFPFFFLIRPPFLFEPSV